MIWLMIWLMIWRMSGQVRTDKPISRPFKELRILGAEITGQNGHFPEGITSLKALIFLLRAINPL